MTDMCFCHVDALTGLQYYSYQYQICTKILKRVSIAILWGSSQTVDVKV